MLQNTIKAFDKCTNLFDEIKAGNKKASELNKLFKELSYLEYRDEYEIIIDNYIAKFINGCQLKREVKVYNYQQRNSRNPYINKTKIVDVFKSVCENLLKEHFVHVRKAFWPAYKKVYDLQKVSYSKSPSQIMEKLKEIENANKRRKAEIKTDH